MIKNLVIVESPAKAKTIEKFLGKDFTVRSSYGHIRDLKKGDNAIDIKNEFKPAYEVDPEKRKLVSELKALAKDAEVVWLATDEDREGEAISWHLFEVLGLKEEATHRIVFHEITKPAIEHAVANPRKIDKYLVDAQQARRVLDRLVGYELSPLLWKKVKPSLSAGRVQSVAVKLIVEREREINTFNVKSDYKITGVFDPGNKQKSFKAELTKRFDEQSEAENFLQNCIGATFKAGAIEVKPTVRNPSPPFITSTLQQEASRKLGFSVTKTMQVAQKLYENGHITYMRTDSVNLSKLAIGAAQDAINKLFGKEYSHTRNFTTKSASAQEAHEAIRPTYFDKKEAGSDSDEKRLYDLIWKRALASQMAQAKLEKTIINILSSKEGIFRAEGEVIKFDGFLKLYRESIDEEDEEEQSGMLPMVTEGQSLDMLNITATQRFSKPAARYNEATLVKKLEELGIGRPSTYAPTTSTIQKRGYVIKENREGKQRKYTELKLENNKITKAELTENIGTEKSKLFPNDIGFMVTDFLNRYFENIMDYGFTAQVEKQFDEIAEGSKSWVKMIDSFYGPFHKNVDETATDAERVTGERELGIDPKTGKTVIVRLAKFGPVAQIGDKDDTPKYANLLKGQSIETITLEEALKLFALPRELGEHNGSPILIGIGRFGPYVKIGERFVSLPKEEDPLTITLEQAIFVVENEGKGGGLPREIGEYQGEKLVASKGRFGPYIKFKSAFVSIPKSIDPLEITLEKAIQLVDAKVLADANKIIKSFPEDKKIQVLNGRYGAYISEGKLNHRIPKDEAPESLTYERVLEIIGKSAPKKGAVKVAANKKASPKKAVAKKATPKKIVKKK